MPTIYEMKENRNNIGQQLKEEKNELYQMSNDTSVSMEDIKRKKIVSETLNNVSILFQNN